MKQIRIRLYFRKSCKLILKVGRDLVDTPRLALAFGPIRIYAEYY